MSENDFISMNELTNLKKTRKLILTHLLKQLNSTHKKTNEKDQAFN